MAQNNLIVGPDHHLTIKDLVKFSLDENVKVSLSKVSKERVKSSRKVIEKVLKEKTVVYGVNTGFGNFKNKIITDEDIKTLQKNLIRSHSTGVGDLLSPEQSRAIMLVRLNSLSQGYSGIRLEFLEFVCDLLNKGIAPVIPSKGSVGSSGDLAPLSHAGLVLMGEGEVWYKGKKVKTSEVLKITKLTPIIFEAKEGLAWNNGTSAMTGIAALTFERAEKLLDLADLGCSLTLEAICGVTDAFDPNVHRIRPHIGQSQSAKNIRNFIQGSKLVNSEKYRVQDSYTLRCAPQVHGAVRDACQYVKSVIEIELNSVTDNPLVFSDNGKVLSGGNFHGEPMAIALDTLGIAISELANISERRTAKLVDPATNEGLPAFLIDIEKAGLNSGLMIPQYTAAALVSENKVLAHPASVDSIPTSANQEDHVSMGTIAARKAFEIIKNTEDVLAIEFLTACQAINFRDPQKLGKETKKIYKSVRKVSPFISEDRELAEDILKIKNLLIE